MKKGDRVSYMRYPVYNNTGNVLYYCRSKAGVFVKRCMYKGYETDNCLVQFDGEIKARRVPIDRIEKRYNS